MKKRIAALVLVFAVVLSVAGVAFAAQTRSVMITSDVTPTPTKGFYAVYARISGIGAASVTVTINGKQFSATGTNSATVDARVQLAKGTRYKVDVVGTVGGEDGSHTYYYTAQ
ncbi:hypothetical protein LJC27_07740 [Christensenellaceae bacterium OttesenSCG-928-M15]|nr:hypothetical protein [Christensenellaceae bacterium OttesenSCG-928-M15]